MSAKDVTGLLVVQRKEPKAAKSLVVCSRAESCKLVAFAHSQLCSSSSPPYFAIDRPWSLPN